MKKYCEKCKKEYPEDYNFCEMCGEKLTKITQKRSTHTKPKLVEKRSIQAWEFGLLLIVCVILSFLIINLLAPSQQKNLTMNGGVTNLGKKCYQVQEPYTVEVPYVYTYRYSVIDSKLEKLFNLQYGEYVKATVTIANTEAKGGNFKVIYTFYSERGNFPQTVEKYIPSHSSATFEFIYDSKTGESVKGSYKVIPPTETRYKTEVRYRTVTKCE